MSAFPDQLTSDLASVCAFDFTDKFSLLSQAWIHGMFQVFFHLFLSFSLLLVSCRITWNDIGVYAWICRWSAPMRSRGICTWPTSRSEQSQNNGKTIGFVLSENEFDFCKLSQFFHILSNWLLIQTISYFRFTEAGLLWGWCCSHTCECLNHLCNLSNQMLLTKVYLTDTDLKPPNLDNANNSINRRSWLKFSFFWGLGYLVGSPPSLAGFRMLRMLQCSSKIFFFWSLKNDFLEK